MPALEFHPVGLENTLLRSDQHFDFSKGVTTGFLALARISSDRAALPHVSIADPTHC